MLIVRSRKRRWWALRSIVPTVVDTHIGCCNTTISAISACRQCVCVEAYQYRRSSDCQPHGLVSMGGRQSYLPADYSYSHTHRLPPPSLPTALTLHFLLHVFMTIWTQPFMSWLTIWWHRKADHPLAGVPNICPPNHSPLSHVHCLDQQVLTA